MFFEMLIVFLKLLACILEITILFVKLCVMKLLFVFLKFYSLVDIELLMLIVWHVCLQLDSLACLKFNASLIAIQLRLGL